MDSDKYESEVGRIFEQIRLNIGMIVMANIDGVKPDPGVIEALTIWPIKYSRLSPNVARPLLVAAAAYMRAVADRMDDSDAGREICTDERSAKIWQSAFDVALKEESVEQLSVTRPDLSAEEVRAFLWASVGPQN
jgi:hypothetical protein